jgi:hypothetical protein
MFMCRTTTTATEKLTALFGDLRPEFGTLSKARSVESPMKCERCNGASMAMSPFLLITEDSKGEIQQVEAS